MIKAADNFYFSSLNEFAIKTVYSLSLPSSITSSSCINRVYVLNAVKTLYASLSLQTHACRLYVCDRGLNSPEEQLLCSDNVRMATLNAGGPALTLSRDSRHDNDVLLSTVCDESTSEPRKGPAT